ncbi:hypothetical protein QJS10_CPA10g01359 [Acorus calamus]|uniref:Late embryogenesis abundant protein n=1 Tax=Acorus calamus TaxID=4465 RepID=A0AAV9DZD7_ACOCL|nr:hypothetical protein QJS10_CPA10g01359 [Acorus calamus]
MATNSVAGFGRRLANQVRIGRFTDPAVVPPSALSVFRETHASAYEKNVDEELRPTVVPDDVIKPKSDKYWGPHPKTGVFIPTGSNSGGTTGSTAEGGSADGGAPSVLDQTAWFRPLEDVEKPKDMSA